MKLIIALSAVLGLIAAKCYKNIHSDFDPEKYKDHEYLCTVYDCFLGYTCCDVPHTFFKTLIREVWQTSCAKCDSVLKHIVYVFLVQAKNGTHQCPYRAREFFSYYDPNGDLKLRLFNAVKNNEKQSTI